MVGTSSACFSDLPGLCFASSGLSDVAGFSGLSEVTGSSDKYCLSDVAVSRLSFSTLFFSGMISFSMGGGVSVFSGGVLRTL